MQRTKRILKGTGVLLGAVVLITLGYIAYVLITYYRVEDLEDLEVVSCRYVRETMQVGEEYSAVTFNIGFGAYTPDYTFFMDGGKESRAVSAESVVECVEGAAAIVRELDPDLILFQEVDVDSTRARHVDQLVLLDEAFAQYDRVYAQNFDSPFLFYPLTQPHGKAKSGIVTYSGYPITSSLRRSLPISESLSRFLDLDRCYSVSRIPVENGRELVLYNVHLSAYGVDASIQEGQMTMLREDMEAELAAGSYVICGGDLNHDLLAEGDAASSLTWAVPLDRSLLADGIHVALDLLPEEEQKMLQRSGRDSGQTLEENLRDDHFYMLDGFLLSDNVHMTGYEVISTGFRYSDHEPVRMTFELEE